NNAVVRADGSSRICPNGIQLDFRTTTTFGGTLDRTFNGPVTYFGVSNRTVSVNNRTTFAGPIGPIGTGYQMTKTGTGTLVLSGDNTITGQITVNQGTLEVAGGTLNTPIINNATFKYTAGTLGPSALLSNYGTVLFNNLNFTSPGISNYSSINFPTGMTITMNNLGLSNEGTITLSNTDITGSGNVTNYATMSGGGIIENQGAFVNYGQLSVNGQLSLTPGNILSNSGEIDLPATGILLLSSIGLDNSGTIRLSGGN